MIEVSRFARRAFAVAAMAFAMSAPVLAGHDVVRDDPGVVSERLHRMGFISWRYVKWDHGYWKIEDARRENGHRYDLKLEAGTFDIVHLKRDRD
ncbi:MAG: PepSY domain-containing protein [Hyphomicrobium denitrificans]|nr:PepSY domain-containing protein [Hyphomicrobium denitrificans]